MKLKQVNSEKTKNEILFEKLQIGLELKKLTTEHEEVKKRLREKVQEANNSWVRELQIKEVLESKLADSKKIDKIQELMKQQVRAEAPNDDMNHLMVMFENNRLTEQNSFMAFQLTEMKEEHEKEVENLKCKLQVEHERAVAFACGIYMEPKEKLVPPPVPPRRNLPMNTNPFVNGNNH